MTAAPSASGPAVAVERLTKRFGDFVAVDDLSFTVASGEIFGFLGPNGAGKTTTIKMLTGLVSPSAGAGTVAGHDLVGGRAAIKRSIGYMSQLFSLYGDLTVSENISFFAGLYGVRGPRLAERRAWVVEAAGLAGQEDQRTGELPLGWKQRLALGCAVLHQPRILFLDEPTSGVDPLARRRFWDLIHDLAEGGTTVFVSTHYMEEAEYCDRLALMNRGRLIALDTPARLRASHGHPMLAVRVEHSPRALTVLRGTPGVLDIGLFGRALHVTLTEERGAAEAIRARLAAAELAVADIRPMKPSLEDVFLARVGQAGGAPDG